MNRTRMSRYVVLQGLPEPAPHACPLHYDALAFQPRVIAYLVAAAAASRSPAAWLVLSGVLLLGATAPRLNPFDAVHAALSRRSPRRVFLPAARAPRRFAQAIGATFCLAATGALLSGQEAVAWGVVVAFGLALVANLGFGFCLGSWLFHSLFRSWTPPEARQRRSSSASFPKVAGIPPDRV